MKRSVAATVTILSNGSNANPAVPRDRLYVRMSVAVSCLVESSIYTYSILVKKIMRHSLVSEGRFIPYIEPPSPSPDRGL